MKIEVLNYGETAQKAYSVDIALVKATVEIETICSSCGQPKKEVYNLKGRWEEGCFEIEEVSRVNSYLSGKELMEITELIQEEYYSYWA